MESPEPVRAHRKLEKLAGHFSGPERMHPSYWNPENTKAEAVSDARVALDGFAVVQDYEQLLDDGVHFAGHGVFRYDMPSDTYELHWFDSTGGPARIFRGGFEGRLLVLTARVGEGWQRLTYDFNLAGGYRFKLETSEDGQRWNLALEGENFETKPARRRSDRKSAPKKAVAKKAGGKQAAKKAEAKKASGRKKAAARTKTKAGKATAKKATAKKASGKKTAAKKPARGAKKASARKAQVTKKAGGVKKAATSRKTAAGKAVAKKPGTKAKSASTKAASKKSASKKAASKKAASKKTAAKKAPAKKTSAKKTASRRSAPHVSATEKRRRQGKQSKKIATRKGDHRPEEKAAPPTRVSQQKRKAGAQYGPRMPNMKNVSTRVGWHKTAAKGKREN